MINSQLKKKILVAVIACMLALCVGIGVICGINASSKSRGNLVAGDNAAANEKGGVAAISDIMESYPVDYVLGPVDVEGANGSNNKYGIPADKYLDIENYIYTKNDSDGKGRILYGWKSDVGKSGKYALIVPSDITVVGTPSDECTDFANGMQLVGVCFDKDSNLKTIEGSETTGAFSGCHSLSFAILPESCKKIGANAFYNSHITYLETYATEIGDNAFAGTDGGDTQWLYFHNSNRADYNIADTAFDCHPHERHVVFENHDLYTAYKDCDGMPTGVSNSAACSANVHYQIPIVANIDNEDSEEFTLSGGDMCDRFYNDSDCIHDHVVKHGQNAITYTKRLSGYSFDYVKQATGEWAQSEDTACSHANPTLSHMQHTCWYAGSDYSDRVTVESAYDPSATSVDIYTKNMCKPQKGHHDNHKSGVHHSAYGDEADFEFTFGQTYTIDGKDYKIGEGEDDCIDFNAILGLSDDYTVTLKSYTYTDGTDGTAQTDSVRNAGDYVLSIGLDSKWGEWSVAYMSDNADDLNATVRVGKAQLDYSSTDKIPAFVNAVNSEYKAHGAITAIYKHNDGWYPSQKYDEEPIEIRTITNSYYYETGNPVRIKISGEYVQQKTNANGEKLYLKKDGTETTSATEEIEEPVVVNGFTVMENGKPKTEKKTYSTTPIIYTNPKSTLKYDDNITLNITDRAGVEYTAPNEYIATFTFNIPSEKQNNYEFYYGNVDSNDVIKDAHKGVSITKRTDSTFVLVKHWFIVYYASTFVADKDVGNGNYPYVPFHDREKLESTDTSTDDGLKGEKNSSVDTITYNSDIAIKIPRARFSGNDGKITFDIIYVDLEGKTHKIANGVNLQTTGAAGSATYSNLEYYFNKTMPAGKYTLKLYGAYPATGTVTDRIVGEYWLTVLPKQLDADSVADIKSTIRGEAISSNPTNDIDDYLNSYVLGSGKLHESLQTSVAALNGTLNSTLGDNDIESYWKSLSAADHAKYFDDSVTIKYNLNGWSSSNYVSESEMKQMLTQADTYTLYYSIAAKNYVTVGGADDENRTACGFRTRFTTGVKISEILSLIKNTGSPYFKDVTYTGNQVHTIVPDSQQYQPSFNDKIGENENYVNVRNGATVTLLLYDTEHTSWQNDTKAADYPEGKSFGDYFVLSDDNTTLTVKFNIVQATNTFTVTPQMSPWTYNDFKKDVNNITAGLMFSGANIYYRLGTRTKNDDDTYTYTWQSVGGSLAAGAEYFEVDENGQISSDVETILNALGAGTYYLCGYIQDSADGNVKGRLVGEQGYGTVVVLQATNSWDTTPYILDWAYNGFDSSKFQAGTTHFGNSSNITYKLTDSAGTEKTSFTGGLSETVTNILNGLEVGTYTLEASLNDGSKNYKALSLPMRFAVTQATNTWKTTPFINSWAYTEFTANNVRAGEAYFGTQVTYKIYEGGTATGSPIMTFNSINDYINDSGNVVADDYAGNKTKVSAKLTALAAKVYTLVASVGETTNYSEVSQTITFTVTKASNSWTTTPVMIGWAYKQFQDSNFQAGATDKGVVTTITYTLYRGTTATGTALKEFKTLNDSVDGEKISVYLSNLEQGTYTLVAYQVGADDYGELSQTMTFSVSKVANTWTTTPFVTGWTYKSFAKAANFKAGEALYNKDANKTVTYKLYAGDENTGTLKTTFTSMDTATENYLTALPAGTYTLVASVEGTDDYADLKLPMTFSVAEATNTWTTTPYMTGWTYKSFANTNFKAGAAKFNEDTNKNITYTLYSEDEETGTVIKTFTSMDTAIKNYFTALSAGQYTLVASLAGTGNYDNLKLPMTFSVSKATNTWTTTPFMTGWTYNGFVEANFKAGVAKFNEDTNKKITYKLYEGESASGTVLKEFTSLNENIVAYFKALPVKTKYTLEASLAGTDNYADLSTPMIFGVTEATNTWTTTPYIIGWTYNSFADANFQEGEAEFGNKTDIKYKLYKGNTTTGTLLFEFNSLADTINSKTISTKFNELAQGGYTLVASLAGTTNYKALSLNLTFDVAQASNAWKTAPQIVGWVYGQFKDSLLTEGEANFGTTAFTVQKVDADGNVSGNYDNNKVRLTKAQLLVMLNSLGAGRYNLLAEIEATGNHDSAEQNIRFSVSKADNDWKTAPSITGWVYNKYNATANAASNGEAKYGSNITYTVKYYSAKSENGTWVQDGAAISAESIKTSVVGDYVMIVTADGDNNYNALEYTVHFAIEKQSIAWDTEPEDRLDWNVSETGTVPDSVTDSALISATIQSIVGVDSYTITYAIDEIDTDIVRKATVAVNVTTTRDTTALIAELNKLGVGTYRITVTVTVGSTGNYDTLEKVVSCTVAQADNAWKTTLNSETWTWGDFNSVKDNLTKPEANYGNNKIVYTVKSGDTVEKTINTADSEYNGDSDKAFAALKTYLGGLNAGTYSVIVSISGTGAPTPINAMYTVNMVTTVWNAATNAVDGKTYNWTMFDVNNEVVVKPVIGTPAAQFGTWGSIAYKLLDGNTSLYSGDSWDDLINRLGQCTAGAYTVSAHINADINHTALDYSVTVNISVAENSWKTKVGDGTTTPKVITRVYGADISDIKFEVEDGHGQVVVTINGNDKSDIGTYIRDNGVGEYLISATVAATNKYGALVDTVLLKITKAENKWLNNLAISGWTWHDNEDNIDTELTLPVAEQGSSALVAVAKKSDSTIVFEATISYAYNSSTGKNTAVNENDRAALERKLKALDVVAGGYTITVSVAETDSYAALADEGAQTKDFVISQATNSWAANGKPTVEAWNFGGDTAYPSATPKFGKNTVVFTYAALSDDDELEDGKRVKPSTNADWKNAPSTQAGSYWLKAYVPGTDNYKALEGYYLFNINAGDNDWVTMPSVVEWSWNGYDASVNLFNGSARSNQDPKFTITFSTGRDLAVTDFAVFGGSFTVTTDEIDRLKEFTLTKNASNNMVVSDDVARLLKALKPGNYVLTVTVEGGESLKSLTGTTTFTVDKAENSWETAPSVRDFSFGNVDTTQTGTLTVGKALYNGTVQYVIKQGESNIGSAITGKDNLINALKQLNAGTYVLNAWVGQGDTYKQLYSQSSPYTTTFTVSPVANSWTTAPQSAVSEYYADIHSTGFNFQEWLVKPKAASGNDAVYTIMNTDYSQGNTEPYTYDAYVNAVKALSAGDYIVRITVPATTNYLALSRDMSLTISRYKTKFTSIPEKLTGKWQQDADKKTATVLDDAVIKASSYTTDGETDTVKAELDVDYYVLAGVAYDTFAELKDAVRSLSSGSYQVNVVIELADGYERLSTTLQLDISAGDNAWITGDNAPAPENSIVIKDDGKKPVNNEWAWNTEVDWLGVKPQYGDTVVIRIVAESDMSNVLKFFTVNTGEGFDTQREIVSTYISKLNVGNYVMIITTPAGNNWNGIDDTASISGISALLDENDSISTRIKFKITEADNGWKQDKSPSFKGSKVSYDNGKYTWDYDASVTPIAEARYGEVIVTYYNKDGEALSEMPIEAGTYTAVFSVPKPSNGNYRAVDETELVFTIIGVVNREFDVFPSVAGWMWHNYDRNVNLFTGKPESGGDVHFEVRGINGAVIIEKFELVDTLGKHVGNFDKDVYAPVDVATKLNELTKGTYTLRVYVDEKGNYGDFYRDVPFNVAEAKNTWEDTPKIASWFRGGWKASENTPVAVSRYGTPVVEITSNASGEKLYAAEYNEQKHEYVASLNLLETADAGWYTMSVSVKGLEGKYTAIEKTDVPFQIFIQGSPDDKNFWEVAPGIEGWAATVDGKVTLPSGKPVRGKPYFVFYKVEVDGNDYKQTDKVVAGEDSVLVEKGDIYAQDFYIPTAPGMYYMYSYAVNIAAPSDALGEDDSSRILLIIRNRANSWEKAVSISSRLYLGDLGNWADPVAEASLPDSAITYSYLDAKTRKDLGAQIPTAPGKYIVVAYANNRYSQEIVSEMEFEVILSKNYWVNDTSPIIESWSEEISGSSPNPVGEAAFGTIMYTYINKADPKKVLTQKPTDAGDYILVARVELDGYETLEARYEFTISPAFDSTLVFINIMLAGVACIFAVVAIIFAIRRNKEN